VGMGVGVGVGEGVGVGILNCLMLSSLPCFPTYCHSTIPTCCYIFVLAPECRDTVLDT